MEKTLDLYLTDEKGRAGAGIEARSDLINCAGRRETYVSLE